MPTVLDDDDDLAIRDEDKTRQFVVPTKGPVIDDLGAAAQATALAAPTADRGAETDDDSEADEAELESSGEVPKTPPPAAPPAPPVEALRASKPAVADDPDAAPTIVIKSIVHEPSSRKPIPLRREATVMVRRAVKRSKKQPWVAGSLVGATVVLALAMGFAGYRRYRENAERERTIELRIEALRRQHR